MSFETLSNNYEYGVLPKVALLREEQPLTIPQQSFNPPNYQVQLGNRFIRFKITFLAFTNEADVYQVLMQRVIYLSNKMSPKISFPYLFNLGPRHFPLRNKEVCNL